jgi:hypothetical protein
MYQQNTRVRDIPAAYAAASASVKGLVLSVELSPFAPVPRHVPRGGEIKI